eukprot:gene12250-14979_t
MKVLIIEDEKTLAYEMAAFLKKAFYLCDLAHTFKSGLEKIELNTYDFILMDLGLPDGDGLDLLQKAKKHNPEAAYIILTARGNLEDRITGLDLGADDYLAKPFYLLELQSRMQAIARRKFNVSEDLMPLGEFNLDLQNRRVLHQGQVIELSKKEFDLLSYLSLHKSRVLTRMQLSEHIWGTYADDDYDSNYIDAHIKNIRKKLNALAPTEWLETVRGSKLAIVILFILLLPSLVKQIALEYTNYTLKEQKKKVLDIVQKNGLHYYLEKDSAYGSYTMLKEEYISLAPAAPGLKVDTIKNARRIVEKDTLNYRILSYTFKNSSRNYLLEIGKTTASINQYDQPLQRFALYVLMVLVLLTILIDLTFTRVLIRPLTKIISTRLVNRKFPFKEQEKEFTANASHELMTPISILQHKMENLLADQQVSESVSLRIIEMMKSLDRLKKISSSLLLISRIENEQFVKRDQVRPLE